MTLKHILFCLASFILCDAGAQTIVNIEDKRSQFLDTIALHERFDAGFNLISNGQQIMTFDGSIQLEFQYHKKIFISLSKFNFVKAGGQRFINEGFQHLRYNSFLNESLTFEAFAQVQYNESIQLKLRGLAGSGLRFKLLSKKENRIYLGMAYMFEYNEENVGERILYSHDNRISAYLSINVKPTNTMTFVSTTYFQPKINRFEDFRLSSESSLYFQISKRLSFKTSFQSTYDSRAPATVDKHIYRFSNGLSYQL